MPAIKSNHKRLPPITIRNAKLKYLNLTGVGKTYNPEGKRNFVVVLDPNDARQFEKDGWNVKWKAPKNDPEGPKEPTLAVEARFDNYPPTVTLIAKGKRVQLNEKTVGMLDRAKVDKFDIVVVASFHDTPTHTGYKAYLQQMFAVLSPDDLESEYIDLE